MEVGICLEIRDPAIEIGEYGDENLLSCCCLEQELEFIPQVGWTVSVLVGHGIETFEIPVSRINFNPLGRDDDCHAARLSVWLEPLMIAPEKLKSYTDFMETNGWEVLDWREFSDAFQATVKRGAEKLGRALAKSE